MGWKKVDVEFNGGRLLSISRKMGEGRKMEGLGAFKSYALADNIVFQAAMSES